MMMVSSLTTERYRLPEGCALVYAKMISVNGEIYFHSEHSYLYNFYLAPIFDNDYTYRSAEHMYQAVKCDLARRPDLRNQVWAAASALEAKHIGDQADTYHTSLNIAGYFQVWML